ncbi:MAG: hypothetical protein A7316_07130 [Candidatus Altiarchaeales archaeon WOR_SM1_86-2]|nr:MAG: hypothetical protein A7315_05540 [Candidatus Altiarchaeales archaeon WOR_SM1_79]ODS38807.1 MAG: hypothetical protein A7316_07130 [Candidatus Altiarchaeales archaeon WOR_SM1_86-2]
MKVGVIESTPLRLDYMNGDFEKAEGLLKEENINIIHRTVATVEPYHATIFVDKSRGDSAKKILEKNKIKIYPPKPFF